MSSHQLVSLGLDRVDSAIDFGFRRMDTRRQTDFPELGPFQDFEKYIDASYICKTQATRKQTDRPNIDFGFRRMNTRRQTLTGLDLYRTLLKNTCLNFKEKRCFAKLWHQYKTLLTSVWDGWTQKDRLTFQNSDWIGSLQDCGWKIHIYLTYIKYICKTILSNLNVMGKERQVEWVIFNTSKSYLRQNWNSKGKILWDAS